MRNSAARTGAKRKVIKPNAAKEADPLQADILKAGLLQADLQEAGLPLKGKILKKGGAKTGKIPAAEETTGAVRADAPSPENAPSPADEDLLMDRIPEKKETNV